MNKFFSTLTMLYAFFSATFLVCSDNEEGTIDLRTHFHSQQQAQQSSLFTLENAQWAATTTATAVLKAAHTTKRICTAAYHAYNNQESQEVYNNVNTAKNSFYCKSDSDSEAGSESDYELFAEEMKHRFYSNQEELQNELQASPDKAIAKLNQAIKGYYKDEDPLDKKVQNALFNMNTLLADSKKNGNELSLQPVIANNYHDIQRNILIRSVQEHVNKIEPSIEEKFDITMKQATLDRDRKIEKAHKKFEADERAANTERARQLTKYKDRLKHIAFNAACLNEKVSPQENHPAHDQVHYESIESYKNLLQSMRELWQSTQKTDELPSEYAAASTSTGKNSKKGKK